MGHQLSNFVSCRRGLRRGMCLGIAGTVLCSAAPAGLNAAVAPWYERVRQFSFVLSAGNDAAAKLASHGLIDRIERRDDGTFRFWAKRCFVPVTLESLPVNETPPRPGTPTQYHVTLGDMHCE